MNISMHYILYLITCISLIQAVKILSVFPYSGPSQYIFGSALLKGLAEKGHKITSISTFPQKKPIKNFRDVAVMENSHLFDDMFIEVSKSDKNFFDEFIKLAEVGEIAITNVYENAQVKALMANEKFDLIIVEIFNSEALLALGEHFKAPVIAVSTFGSISFMDYLVGNPSPLSYIPHMGLPYDNRMSLKQRIGNVLMSASDLLCLNYIMLPHQLKIYQKYFPKASMSLDEARKNVSLVLLNNHFTLNFPRPYVRNMIEVGGLHIKQQPDALPNNLKKFWMNPRRVPSTFQWVPM